MKFIKFLALILLILPFNSLAQGLFSVSTKDIEVKLHPAEESYQEIKITNLAPRRFTSVYVFVKYLGSKDNDPFGPRWLEVPRYVELKPGESRELKLKFIFDRLYATGVYNAEISFVEAMDEAGARRVIDTAEKIRVKAEVYRDKIDRLQITSFLADKNIYFKTPIILKYKIENVGDTGISPDVNVAIYNEDGEIIKLDNLRSDKITISPREKIESSLTVNDNLGRGRFKAIITVDYDKNSVTETVYFTVSSRVRIGLIFLVSISLLLVLVNFSYRAYEKSFTD